MFSFLPRDACAVRVFSHPSRTITLARSAGEIRDGDKADIEEEGKRVPRAAESNKTRRAGELNPFVAATSFCVARRRKSAGSGIFAFRRFLPRNETLACTG